MIPDINYPSCCGFLLYFIPNTPFYSLFMSLFFVNWIYLLSFLEGLRSARLLGLENANAIKKGLFLSLKIPGWTSSNSKNISQVLIIYSVPNSTLLCINIIL